MDTPMDTPGPVQPTPAPTIYSNPVVNNDKPRLDEFPLLFESLGLPAREDWAYVLAFFYALRGLGMLSLIQSR
ncbi:hypothetical protein QFC19_007597 [Naganishia cerealis]|uniref:Uncharacterized protein n=1 Tax=Naganishia cerealis TaxID=610337 RepID=A0ACC2V8A0_9TREE|nr:hypothetical protein QFC19_007597 [Naganishia cerealis]